MPYISCLGMVEKFETVNADLVVSSVEANNHSIPNSRGSGGISNTDRAWKCRT